jgi:hypothetical protein
MAEIKSVSKNAFGRMVLDQYVDTSTGQIEVRSGGFLGGKGDLLAISTGKNWKLVDAEGFRRRYNNLQTINGLQTVTEDEFERAFNNIGVPQFNNDRAAVLNNPENYESIEISEGNRGAFYQKNIPLVKDPRTGLMVASTGVKQTQPTQEEQPQTQNNQNRDGGGNQDEPTVGLTAQEQSSLNEIIAREGRRKGGDQSLLRYPLDPSGPFQYDYISITAYDYKPSGLGISAGAFEADKNIGKKYETVILPMQPTLSETNGVSWSNDQLDPVKAAFGKAAITAIEGMGDKNISAIGDAIKDLGGTIGGALGDPATKSYVAAYFAGQAVGANLVGRSSGMVINPNLELLFNGPNLRSFNFNFKLTPRSAEESNMCRKIIKSFKRNMAVARSESNLFLISPRIFKLKYHFKSQDTDHPFLNKFKPCALTNFGVNYTPDGSYATFQDGGMTQYNLDFTFSEVMPIYSEDIRDDGTATMGY